MKKLSALDVHKLLPHKNCGKCGCKTCMEFAVALLERKKKVAECIHLTDKTKLEEILRSPVRGVEFGEQTLGDEQVMHRHELRFFNPPLLVLEIKDEMKDDEIKKRVRTVINQRVERMGKMSGWDGVAMRLNDEKRVGTVTKLCKDCENFVLFCKTGEIAQKAMDSLKGKNLIVACDDYESVKKNGAVLLITGKSMQELGENVQKAGYDKIVLKPPESSLQEGANNNVMARLSAINNVEELGWPIVNDATSAYDKAGGISAKILESVMASTFINRYSSVIILRNPETWGILPVLALRDAVYSDPKEKSQVDAGVYEINKPGKDSPVLVTVNYSLTYHIVRNDLEKAKISCWLVVVDTGGYAVDSGIAAGNFDGERVKKALEGMEKKVKNKVLLIPQLASKISGDIEDSTGWKVVVGTRDSSQIADFLKKQKLR